MVGVGIGDAGQKLLITPGSKVLRQHGGVAAGGAGAVILPAGLPDADFLVVAKQDIDPVSAAGKVGIHEQKLVKIDRPLVREALDVIRAAMFSPAVVKL